MTDQALEQHIKVLKRYGGLPGITQEEDTMNRFVTTSPYLSRYVDQFLSTFPKHEDNEEETYQLQGNMGLRCAINATRSGFAL